MRILIPCLVAFWASAAVTVTYNMPKKYIAPTCLGGALGWMVYLLIPNSSDFIKYFFAAAVITVYAEIMARIWKAPTTIFLTAALLPLVPGAGMYYTMQYCFKGETELFYETGFHTLALAGALVLGIMIVTSLVRMWKILVTPERFFGDKVQRENY